jgi:hypothetical protein
MRFVGLPVLVLASALAGCVNFFPHFVRTQPEVDGVPVAAGAPRAGVRISACEGLVGAGLELTPSRCDRAAVATTDAQGHFHLEAHGYVDTDLGPMGDRSTFEILAVVSGGRELVWHQVWQRPAPPRLTLACELGDRLVCQAPQVP